MEVTYECRECKGHNLKILLEEDVGHICIDCGALWGLTKDEEELWEYVATENGKIIEELRDKIRNFKNALRDFGCF